MNLSEMVAQICADTGYLDTDDVAFAKTALRQRDDLLYRMGLWKDSLVQVNLTVDPTTNDDHAEGVIYLPEVIERVIAVRTADTAVNVSGLETFYRIPFDKFSQTGLPWEFAKLRPGWFTWRAATGEANPYIAFFSRAAADASAAMRIVWFDANGEQQVTNGNLTIPATPTDLQLESSRIEISAAFKPVTAGAVALYSSTPGEDAFKILAAETTASPRYQRIRIIPIPQAATGLKILGKAKYVPLDFDQQEPQVTGSHLALMAFAKHALRKRGGEHGAAADDLQEAMGLMEVLKREELQQEANNQRIIPESGYGDAFFGPGRDGFFVG